jgi:hypothetical protein
VPLGIVRCRTDFTHSGRIPAMRGCLQAASLAPCSTASTLSSAM